MARLNRINEINIGDLIVIWSQQCADYRGAPLTLFLDFLNENLDQLNAQRTQYNTPIATDFSIPVLYSPNDVFLIITPVAGFADGEIVLPALSTLRDKQQINVVCTMQVDTFVVDGNGANVVGAPGVLAAESFFTLQFDAVTSTWYRIA